MRLILLQDAVILKQRNPENKILEATVFGTPEFLQFEGALLKTMAETTPPAELQLRAIAPQINRRIDDLASNILAIGRAAGVQQQIELENVFEAMKAGFSSLEASINILSRQQRTLQVAYIAGDSVCQVSGGETDRQGSSGGRTDEDVSNKRKRDELDEPVYCLRRDLKTVGDVWKEWTVGIEDSPSVNYLNEKYKTSWRSNSKGKQLSNIIFSAFFFKLLMLL